MRTSLPAWHQRLGPAALALLAMLLTCVVVGELPSAFLLIILTSSLGSAGGWGTHEVEMDAEGIRGGESGDRMTWPYIESVELVDVSWWRSASQVHGRWGNLVEVGQHLRADDHDAHPAELIAAEARARGIEVRGSVAARSGRWRTVFAVVIGAAAGLVSPAVEALLD